jgi:hypothetical protein
MRSSGLYLEVATAVLLVAVVGIISVFIAAAFTTDRAVMVGASCAIMVVTGAVLVARLWRLSHASLKE